MPINLGDFLACIMALEPNNGRPLATVNNLNVGRCICNWKNCPDYQDFFTGCLHAGEPELRGGECIKLDLSGSGSPKMTKWWDLVLSNLGRKPKDINNLKRVHVARHHWTAKQLLSFQQWLPSTPVSEKELRDLTPIFDPKNKFEYHRDQYMCCKYFNVPNIPENTVKYEARRWFQKRLVHVAAQGNPKISGSGKCLTHEREQIEKLHEQNNQTLKLSAQNSPEELLQQLELHEELHRLYEDKY